ncbi:MAG: bifunctional phosphopantothenoylcysteine decarboxylase/phosphopantothenate--cysteine ligase CoaBC [Bdellovibrionaceae bacterium]|nr:bifunctional phosphopantothenoylcysteine decarboxylase/phosphopantothenate--cysteine ligase CoaBC [Pseudobdellovibrionaceae bacterium]
MSKSKILFKMTGSIAAFKAAALLSKLKQQGHEIQVVASPAALQFIGAATLEGLTGRPVLTDLWEKGHAMDHIHAMRWADLIVVCPASAHFINRIAQGVGDDLLTTMFLAHDFKKPYLIAPAMNTSMYLHPATQKSIQTLRDWKLEILESASGVLACGEQGYGRLLEPDLLLEEITKRLGAPAAPIVAETKSAPVTAFSPRVLITAGGTIEPIDDVRHIANESTGQTGVDIANALAEMGAEVTLLAAKHAPRSAANLRRREFRTYQDLADALKSELSERDYTHIIHAAAVSDYSVAKVVQGSFEVGGGKIPSGSPLTLELRPNPKIITQLKPWSRNKTAKIVGFKLTSQLSDEEARQKVKTLFDQCPCEFVVQNDQRGLNREKNEHPYQIFRSDLSVAASGTTRADLVQKLSSLIAEVL